MSGSSLDPSAPHTLGSVAHALDVLAILADADRPVRVVDVARRLDVAPSTAHRILATLVGAGYALRSATSRRYRRGPSLVRLGSRPVAPPILVQQVAHAHLVRLAADTGLSTNLAVLDGLDVVAVDHVDAFGSGRHVDGARLPAHATALGQAILAYAPEAVGALVAAGLARHTMRTQTDEADLRRTLREVRRRGYAVNVGNWKPETAGVAAAIRDRKGEVLAAIGITGPSDAFQRPQVVRVRGDLVRDAASAITAQLAQRPSQHG